MMKKGVESCGAQAAQAKEATSTGANVLEIPERGAQEPTPAWAEMGVADPTITFQQPARSAAAPAATCRRSRGSPRAGRPRGSAPASSDASAPRRATALSLRAPAAHPDR